MRGDNSSLQVTEMPAAKKKLEAKSVFSINWEPEGLSSPDSLRLLKI